MIMIIHDPGGGVRGGSPREGNLHLLPGPRPHRPYNQAVSVDDVLYISGQVGVIMTIL